MGHGKRPLEYVHLDLLKGPSSLLKPNGK